MLVRQVFATSTLITVSLAGFALALSPAVFSQQLSSFSSTNCTFQAAPDQFLSQQSRVTREVQKRILMTRGLGVSGGGRKSVASIPHRNFVDDEIFATMQTANVAPAALTTDEEFFRRISLDLTGQIPSSQQVRDFVADTDPAKRDKVIDTLLYSPAFTDKWTQWMGDLTSLVRVNSNSNVYPEGRNSFYTYLRSAIAANRPLSQISREIVTVKGNSFVDTKPVGFVPLQANVAGGPIQDKYDAMFSRSAEAFLGMAHYDCILCHSGRGHLDLINLWGKTAVRTDAEQMAAFFSRMQMSQQGPVAVGVTPATPVYSWTVSDSTAATAGYKLNTNYGNRPARVPVNGVSVLQPKYRDTGATPSGVDWRGSFGDNMVADPMFARNFANRLWKSMFNLGLVDPVDTLDPARLDPNNPPTDPAWSLQATHPVLLEKLAGELKRNGFNLREFLRLLVQSNAYQLSTHYDGQWSAAYVPLFARHYARRLDAEEVHDAVVAATGLPARYTVSGWAEPAETAMQLPDPLEPMGSGINAFLNSFLRGNRDTLLRSQSPSILQQLSLMNDPFVIRRIHYAASPTIQRAAFQPDDAHAVEELFLSFLSREPTAEETAKASAYLHSATNRNSALEDLAWACVNKLDFVFSY